MALISVVKTTSSGPAFSKSSIISSAVGGQGGTSNSGDFLKPNMAGGDSSFFLSSKKIADVSIFSQKIIPKISAVEELF